MTSTLAIYWSRPIVGVSVLIVITKIATQYLVILISVFMVGLTCVHAESLRLGDFQSIRHIVSIEGTTKWMEAVEKATDGTITFEHFPSQQAAKSVAQLDAVNNGILDLSLIGALYHSDVLPLNSVVGLPGFYSTAAQGTEVLQTMLAEGPLRDELLDSGVTPIFGFVLPPYQVLAKKRIAMPADWDALDVRTSGSTQAMTARALGAVGISIPGPEVYAAVERGRLDAIFFPLTSVPGYKLKEIVNHISTNGSFGGYSFIMIARTELFNALSDNVRSEMVRLGAQTAVHVAEAQDASVAGLLREWQEQGINTYEFTDEELESLRSSLAEVSMDWLDRFYFIDNAAAVLEMYRKSTSK